MNLETGMVFGLITKMEILKVKLNISGVIIKPMLKYDINGILLKTPN